MFFGNFWASFILLEQKHSQPSTEVTGQIKKGYSAPANIDIIQYNTLANEAEGKRASWS